MITAGVDVGGPKKGFHWAVLRDAEIIALAQARDPETIASVFRLYMPDVVAIDAPARATRPTAEVRPAELALRRAGYRIQWTRQADPPGWMVQGERLWAALREFRCVETFPTAVHDQIASCSVRLPLNLLPGGPERGEARDQLDACLAAWAAQRGLSGQALVFGEDDPLGPIWV